MNFFTVFILLIFCAYNFFPQQNFPRETPQRLNIPDEFIHKIGSGELLKIIQKNPFEIRQPGSSLNKESGEEYVDLLIYLSHDINSSEKNLLASLNIDYNELLIPAVENHPFGFFFAKAPLNNLQEILSLDFVARIETVGDISFPQNNEAVRKIKADCIWGKGITGRGIKIAVLDSGLDTTFSGTEFPVYISKTDYSGYPSVDNDIANNVTGHGTHVTGSVLARGVLSANNTGNGTGPYMGVAPGAELIFLKIGNDNNGGANTTAIVEALKAAVNIYGADVITMSYGSWDIYHDGSNVKDQTVDWCYSQGVPVFIPAGNNGASRRHISGFVGAYDSSDLIRVNVSNVIENSTYLSFNLVWYDGQERRNLTLKYYDESGQEIPNIYHWTATQSSRGTESKLSQGLFQIPTGNSIYFLRVINYSGSGQQYHIYEHYNDGRVTFEVNDPAYTIISPGTADHAFTVGSFVSRIEWTSYNGLLNCSAQNELERIYSYSSRGPRVDGLQKPDIVAPGSSIISLRDGNVYKDPNIFFIDNDGNTLGDYNYLVMEGTSMSAPFCAGAAALYLEKNPDAGPDEVYSTLRSHAFKDTHTGNVPNSDYGYGKLDAYSALFPSDPLPVELSSLTAELINNSVELNWSTTTEINNYGFDIERKYISGNDDEKNRDYGWTLIGFVKGSGNSNSPKFYTFTDKNLTADGTYYYRIKQIDISSISDYSREIKISYAHPEKFELYQNFPNPFNPSTKIRYSIPSSLNNSSPVNVNLKIYDLIGRELAVLVNETQLPGLYEVEFNPEKAMPGILLPSGVYFSKLSAGQFSSSKKMLYIR